MKICEECGKEIKETSRECPHCGTAQDAKEASGRSEVVMLAELAMMGDDSVWGEIFEKTRRYVYYMALKTLRDDQDAQDITQEVYIKAMDSIGQLHSSDSFFAWLRSIIFSKCKDLVKKKKPILLDDDEDGDSPLDDMPEENEEFLPERVLDSAETRRMVLELVDDLPMLQRQTVMFFYYDEMTVDQIATLMECASGTVKSRLNYARQQIKKGVEEYEKKGVKLYGVAVLPILTILLREQAGTLTIPKTLAGGIGAALGAAAGTAAGGATSAAVSGGTSGAVLGGTAGAAGSAAASTATATSVALTAKIIAGVIAATVVIGGGAMLLTNNSEDSEAPPPSISAPVEPETIESNVPETDFHNEQPLLPVSASEEPASETPEEISYYDTLSDEQKQMLSRLIDVVRAGDHSAAHDIQKSTAFHNLCENIPDWGGFWYYPDDETSILIYSMLNDEYSYEIAAYFGKDGNGSFRLGKYVRYECVFYYILHETAYSGGKANGVFKEFIYDYAFGDAPDFYTYNGTLNNGIAYVTLIVARSDGEVTENPVVEGFFDWWPDWPEGR